MTDPDWPDDDRRALEAFLAQRGICTGPVTTRAIGEGHSNRTTLVSDGHRSVVVRRPPPPPVAPGAHDVLREAAWLRALQETAVPVPALLATAAAGEVGDSPLYVMDHVAGTVVTSAMPAALATPAHRRAVGESLADTLAALHAVDPRSVELAHPGRSEGSNARHLARLRRLLPDDGLPAGLAEVDAWLSAHVPAESAAAIVHNDYRLGNVVLAPDPPGRVAAVLDWELATVGDPLVDVGYLLATCPAAGEPRTPLGELGLAMLEEGFPTRAELLERYASAAGRDPGDLRWYTVLASWRLAVLFEYSHRRAVAGVGDPYYLDRTQVTAFVTAARRAIDSC